MPLFQLFIPKSAADVAPETRPIFQAIRVANVAAVASLIAAGEDVNIASAFRLTPLHFACREYHGRTGPSLCRAPNSEAIIRLLLDAGASLTARDALGHMPSEYCEGHPPRFLAEAMLEAARNGTWPEPNPADAYSEGEVRHRLSGINRRTNFIPTAKYVQWKRAPKTEAA